LDMWINMSSLCEAYPIVKVQQRLMFNSGVRDAEWRIRFRCPGNRSVQISCSMPHRVLPARERLKP
jgi:hypothetical protein